MNYLEARHNLPVPINIRFTKGISDHLVTATFDGIEDLVAASGQNREITGFRTKKLDLANLLQAETYVLRAFEMYGHGQDKGYGPQAPIQGIISSVNDSPEREKPQWLILVINEPLRDAVSGDFGFAATDPIYLVSVLSTFGIERELEDTHMQMAVMRRFARHEGGHLFKITNYRSQNVSQVPDITRGHCLTDYCTMVQNFSLLGFAYGAKLEEKAKAYFCPDDFSGFERHPSFNPEIPRTNYRGSYVRFMPWDQLRRPLG